MESENSDLTFKPAINDKSIRLAERVAAEYADASGDLLGRLEAQHQMSVHKRLSKVAAIEDERAQNERFQPEINRNNSLLLILSLSLSLSLVPPPPPLSRARSLSLSLSRALSACASARVTN